MSKFCSSERLILLRNIDGTFKSVRNHPLCSTDPSSTVYYTINNRICHRKKEVLERDLCFIYVSDK